MRRERAHAGWGAGAEKRASEHARCGLLARATVPPPKFAPSAGFPERCARHGSCWAPNTPVTVGEARVCCVWGAARRRAAACREARARRR